MIASLGDPPARFSGHQAKPRPPMWLCVLAMILNIAAVASIAYCIIRWITHA